MIPSLSSGPGPDEPDRSRKPDPRDADDRTSETESVSDDQLDEIDPEQRGREEGQVSGTPEDGDSFYDVVE